MDGLYRISGAKVPLTIGDKTYFASPECGSFETLGMIEAYAVSKRRKALAAIAESLHLFGEEQQKLIIKTALEMDSQIARGATGDEINAVLETREGLALCLWAALKPNHPEIDSHEKAIALLRSLNETQLRVLKGDIDRVAGYDHLGNSSGLDETATTTTNPENAASDSPGPASTVN